MDPMRILAKPDNRVKLDPMNGISLQLMFFESLPFVADFFVFDHVWIPKIS